MNRLISKYSKLSLLVGIASFSLIAGAPVNAQTGGSSADPKPGDAKADEQRIEFQADNLDYDFEADVVVASGNVTLERQGYKLRADQVVWNRKNGEVNATGSVRATGPDGETAYGDTIKLQDNLRDGVVENMLLVLENGGRLAANRGERANQHIILNEAAYSPCAVEKADGCPKEPTWQIKAVKVIYDQKRQRIKYQGARIELFGLPVIPLPGLSHPVGDDAGSGLLVPDISVNAVNGVEYAQPYYLKLGSNRDVTLTPHFYTNVLPMLKGQYRSLEKNGAFQITGYATYSSRISTGGAIVPGATNDFRGYVDTSGKFQLSPEWSVSTSARVTTDRTFLRRYDISRDDRLRSTVNVERIGESSYFSLAGWAVQTLRVNDPQGQVPVALPVVEYRKRLTDPVLGGKLQFHLNSLAIGRTSGQDTQRAFASVQWDLRRYTSLGQEITFTAYGRGDVYHSDENNLTSTAIYRGNSGWSTRAIASAAIDVRWPLVGEAFGGTQTLTPRIQIVATPQVDNISIPNEDARAVDLEDSNLFALNRFPGYDRYEDNGRITYGLEWSLQRPGLEVNAVIGQSYRLFGATNLFPDGTGLSDRVSDIVGRTEVRFKDVVKFTHRYRLDKDNLTIRRNEIDATIGSRKTYAQVGYLRLDRDIGPQIEDLQDREEIRLAGRLQIDNNWSIFGSTIIDLTSQREEPRTISDGYAPIRHRVGIAYDDDCLSVAVTWKREYEDTGDARRGSTFLFRLAFRNLGV